MTLDTNILIAYLKGEEKVVSFVSTLRASGRIFLISSVSVAELLALPTLSAREREIILAFVATFVSVPLDNEVAEPAALLRGVYRLPLPDAAIAATALINNVPLVTRDKAFRKIRGLSVIDL